jgi:hypothetical protein
VEVIRRCFIAMPINPELSCVSSTSHGRPQGEDKGEALAPRWKIGKKFKQHIY